ncbi:c-type cytochrome [Roseococcus microcysteis]|uniref:c-type cytochrome n=1 Tax=Roseococcus microcysteis TaxID=2771361 RepID=UPI00168A68D9|nr:c-type cytochrome [Roseococcus microcysteis]
MRALTFLAAALLAAANPAWAGDATRGAALAEARNCGACHGANGISAVPLMPSLAGQQAEFLLVQLIMFREGLRPVPAMVEPARGLTDAEIEDLAAFYATLPSGPAATDPRNEALAARGAELSAARNCGTCHRPDYSGQAQVPRINHQREDFLVHTLAEYRDNLRVGMDTQMNGVMHGMTNADIRAIAHYLAHR